jgi:hypothetical protein
LPIRVTSLQTQHFTNGHDRKGDFQPGVSKSLAQVATTAALPHDLANGSERDLDTPDFPPVVSEYGTQGHP